MATGEVHGVAATHSRDHGHVGQIAALNNRLSTERRWAGADPSRSSHLPPPTHAGITVYRPHSAGVEATFDASTTPGMLGSSTVL
jgi:hypothetical protein